MVHPYHTARVALYEIKLDVKMKLQRNAKVTQNIFLEVR